ncbi:MAG: EAL domain-containing protein [Planctomycetota bacterium]
MDLPHQSDTPASCPSVLVIDDDPSIAMLVTARLKSIGAQTTSALNGEQGIAKALDNKPDLIILDYELPGEHGIDILKRLKSNEQLSEIPVIFATGNDSNDVLSACFDAGAADYVRKPLYAAELRSRVTAVLDKQRLIGRLSDMAWKDALTGLPNRAAIRVDITDAVNRVQKGEHGLNALLFLDFDRFKIINDSLGHDIGDLLLIGIAERLYNAIDEAPSLSIQADSIKPARLGGDEFVVLLQNIASRDVAIKFADLLLTHFAERYDLNGNEVVSTASIGVLIADEQYKAAEDVLRDADTAMYAAKNAGKGRYIEFDQSMRDQAEARLRIENELRSAVFSNQFSVAYQPIVCLETGKAMAFEALLRWPHAIEGNLSPSEFVPIAEDSGLIIPIGEFVLREACNQLAEWRRDLGEKAPDSIHINVSRKQIMGTDLVELVQSIIEEYELPPSSIHIEVTENEIMMDASAAVRVLDDLRKLGVKIDMDDFGTGHSSLSCLRELPIDVLKIDRSFVSNVERGRDFAAMLHAVATLAQNLGLKVVAEGIETKEQLAVLQSLGCDLGQGYYLGKPMSMSDATNYLEGKCTVNLSNMPQRRRSNRRRAA